MPDPDALRTFAELGIALAGFSGIVAVLGRRSQGQWSELERARLFALLSTSLGATFFSVLPELFREASRPDGWLRAAHACMVAYQGGAIAFYFSRAKPGQHAMFADRLVAVTLTGLGGLLLLAQAAVVGGLLAGVAGPLYVAALLYLLLVGSANFVLLLLQPGRRAAGGA